MHPAAPMPALPPPTPPPPDAEEEGEGFDLQATVDYARFALTAPLRHKLLSVVAFVLTLGLTALLIWALPRTYHCETSLLAQRSQLQGLSGATDGDDPMHLVLQNVMRHDSMVALAEEWHNLLQQTDKICLYLLSFPLAVFHCRDDP